MAIAVLLLVLAAAQISSVVQESQSYDESVHLAAGYSYWKTGDFRLNPEHPPLAKLLTSLPLLFSDLVPVTSYPEWQKPAGMGEFDLGTSFLYRNRLPADTLLLRGRLVTIALTLCLGLAITLWTRSRFGAPAAILALAFFCLDPNVIAHGRYVTTDMIAALTIFLSCISWARYLETDRPRDLVLAGLLFGLALVSKFSTVFLLPLHILLFLIYKRNWRSPWFVLSIATLMVFGAVVILAVYGPETKAMLMKAPASTDAGATALLRKQPLQEVADARTTIGSLLSWSARKLRLPAHSYLVGLNSVSSHNIDGQESYLLGQYSQFGWWYYFPIVFLVKTPLAVLLALVIGLPLALVAFRKPAGPIPLGWLVVAITPVFYFLLSMQSQLNLGVRHILPIYPFLYIALAAVLCSVQWRWFLVPAVMAVLLVENATIYPHYLAFFNIASGGPANGPAILLDSNIDWGQDIKKLKIFMDQTPGQKFCIEYFGSADLRYYKLPDPYIPKTADVEGRANANCMAAISATLLHDLYIPKGSYQWLRQKTPLAKVGYSIYVYDLRKPNAGQGLP